MTIFITLVLKSLWILLMFYIHRAIKEDSVLKLRHATDPILVALTLILLQPQLPKFIWNQTSSLFADQGEDDERRRLYGAMGEKTFKTYVINAVERFCAEDAWTCRSVVEYDKGWDITMGRTMFRISIVETKTPTDTTLVMTNAKQCNFKTTNGRRVALCSSPLTK